MVAKMLRRDEMVCEDRMESEVCKLYITRYAPTSTRTIFQDRAACLHGCATVMYVIRTWVHMHVMGAGDSRVGAQGFTWTCKEATRRSLERDICKDAGE